MDYNQNMGDIQITSVLSPFQDPEIARPAFASLARAQAMGLLPEDVAIRELGWDCIDVLVREMAAAGIARQALAELLSKPRPTDRGRILSLLGTIGAALEDSPVPVREWPALVGVLGHERLARLLRISPASVRRYAAGHRATPDVVAARLHLLALIVGDLSGTYNEYGIRRWFERTRTPLQGLSPEDILGDEWSPDDEGSARLRDLARSLLDPGAT